MVFAEFEKFKNSTEHLTEEKLYSFLKERLDNNIIYNKYLTDHKIKPDFRSEKFKLIVEFDGYKHYYEPKQILKDFSNNQIYLKAGYNIVRIPYFIQLHKQIIELLFGKYKIDTTPQTNFPNGFVSIKAGLPANFCELGIIRFVHELKIFEIVKTEIIESIIYKIQDKKDWAIVLPPSLKYLINDFNIKESCYPIVEVARQL